MSDATNKQIPLINDAATTGNDELDAIARDAATSALIGQRDEALQRAADLFVRLTVIQHVAGKLDAENKELKLDIEALKAANGLPTASS